MRVGVKGFAPVRDAHLLEQLERTALGRAAVEAEVEANVLGQLAPDREHRVERRHRVLEDHREVAPGELATPCGGKGEQVVAVEAHAPLDRSSVRQHAEQCQHRHRLSAAALPGDAEHLPVLDPVIDSVDDGEQTARGGQPHPQPVDLEQAHESSGCRKPVRGSNTSRRLSPRKLNASTTVKIARPGNVPIHHHWKYCVPSATIDPHSACGG